MPATRSTDAGYTLEDIAERFALTLRGEAGTRVTGVATLANAAATDVAFLANPLYRNQVAQTRAAAVILREEDASLAPNGALIARDPYSAFAKISALFDPDPEPVPGVHASAVVDDTATIAATAQIGPHCVIGARSEVEDGAIIGPGCTIGEDCVIGAGCTLVARVSLVKRVRLGRRVRIHPGAVLGADGFGLAQDVDGNGERHWIKVPQQGGVVIGDDCEIGANTTIDRGALDDTILGRDVRLDNQIQIGHNVVIGDHTAMAGCVAVAGSTRIGSRCLIGGAAGIVGHLEICDGVVVTAMSLVTHSIDTPGQYSSGTPLMDSRSWRRSATRFKQLDELARRIARLSKESL